MSTRPAHPECIRLRGVRQNNLKGFDLDIPLGRYVVVTGLSGAGKSSLVFDTLHAEGQRRYVETFSAYTRQFLDLLQKPDVDSIENVRPSIAVEQSNTVRTSRSTVGTMTELTDFFKVWFSHAAECFDSATGEKVEDDHPESIWEKSFATRRGQNVLLTFRVDRPANLTWPDILKNLRGQSYVRLLLSPPKGPPAIHRIDALEADSRPLKGVDICHVIQDRIALAPENRARFLEAAEAALHFGHGQMQVIALPESGPAGPETQPPAEPQITSYSRGLHSPTTGRTFRPATPALFSFNSPLGACPKCRGFGRVIEIDFNLALPDRSLSIDDGAIKCWESEVYGDSKKDLLTFARRLKIPTDIPFADLTREHQDFIIEGEPGYGEENNRTWPKFWYGIKGFFRWLEKNTYKMHVRVFLSRYRSYVPCPDCAGTRLQPEALCWKWKGRTLPQLYQLSVRELLPLLSPDRPVTPDRESPAADRADAATGPDAPADRSASIALESIRTRLRYLEQVGLDYLTLDRASRTLSGGEIQRVNLTSCLGTSLVDTLFVLDEPSVGLHARDIDRLLGIIRRLTDAGNTVVVVEHDEAMIRAADHVIEIGPEPGSRGGQVVFSGTIPGMLASSASITGAYLSHRRAIPLPAKRRPVDPQSKSQPWLEVTNATKHNLRHLSFRLPLRRLVCLSGVSGSGKSTLLDQVIHQNLLIQRHQLTEDPAEISSIRSGLPFDEVVSVDQSPLSRTPRSNAALYTEVWELVRGLFAATPEAQKAGYTSSSFSFNSGDGRCDHCSGLGHERVEMQFLSDVFVPCPVCEGRRFKPEVLAIQWRGKSVADLLATSVHDALEFFHDFPGFRRRLAPLEAVGLGYLTLGQPLNTLSGGESQRLKLVRYLGQFGSDPADPHPDEPSPSAGHSLLLLDEPTTGLHRHDVGRLLHVLQALVDAGHSVIVIEHNLDVLKSADWILEIGPDSGAQGGRIVAEGPPETVAGIATATSPYLRDALRAESSERTLLVAEDPETTPPIGIESRAPAAGEGLLAIEGARENNLKNLTVSIGHRDLTVVTGVSGSGKSTLAFDIVFAEGQRRFMESMSPYARQFVEQLPRPAVDRVTGIPPTVAIEQRVTRGSRKSTVATITEVAQYLRLLYARLGVQHHPETDRPVKPLSPAELRRLLARVQSGAPARRARHLYLCAPVVKGRKGHHQPMADWAGNHGYTLLRIDGVFVRVDEFQKLDRYREHDIEVVVEDLKNPGSVRDSGRHPKSARSTARPADPLEEALQLGRGACFLMTDRDQLLSWFSTTRTDQETGESFPELDPKHFSFNSPRGWCPSCRGHGRIFPWMLATAEEAEGEDGGLARLREFGVESADEVAEEGQPCPECRGERLNRSARAVKLHFRKSPPLSLPALLRLTPDALVRSLASLELDRRGRLVARDIIAPIRERLAFLDHVGLGYLALERPTATLSGGEAQRIRLAAQLGSNLSGVLYVLDEPSIGLHARDNEKLIGTLEALRDKGNTVLVVEHDDELMDRADRIIDLGPGAGRHGGELLAIGTPDEIRSHAGSLTGHFLARGIAHPLQGFYRPVSFGSPKKSVRIRRRTAAASTEPTQSVPRWLELGGVRFRNLDDIDLRIPLGRLVVAAGPSGAGKSTLLRDVLTPAISRAIEEKSARLTGRKFLQGGGIAIDDAPAGAKPLPPFRELRGAQGFGAVIEVDQSPIGKTPRSTPATYLGIFDLIRQFFASLPEARLRGFTASRFSFNTSGGRCPTCEGAGRIKLEMAFMPDTYLPCDDCRGSRYSNDLADITWKGKAIGGVLQLTFEEAADFFDFHSQLSQVCRLMVDCGLGYLTLGQSSPTLSGGEAQRLKLVTELSRGLASYRQRSRGELPKNFYLLEEPTIGLHLSDCEKLIRVLHSLVDQGHTVVVIEHHLDVIAEADYVIELGPGGGPDGGRVLYQGALPGLLKTRNSPTAPYLRAKLSATRHS